MAGHEAALIARLIKPRSRNFRAATRAAHGLARDECLPCGLRRMPLAVLFAGDESVRLEHLKHTVNFVARAGGAGLP
jgi:hypothetical protein